MAQREDRSDERARDERGPTERLTQRTTGDDERDRQLADQGTPVGEVVVMVCVECGEEYPFDREPPEDLVCDRCGNSVFRTFIGQAPRDDEAEEDFRDSTERDLAADAGASDVRPGDLYDLNNP